MMTLISSLKTGNSLPMKSDQQTKLFFFFGGGGDINVFLFNRYMKWIFTLCVQIRESSYHGKFQNSKLPES